MGDASAWATGVRNKGKETGYRTRGVNERKLVSARQLSRIDLKRGAGNLMQVYTRPE
ncbi:hypothetical protein PoMZ_09919 [Pyricularia oryzae]|uniref:Uncharacterized protein n=1 Tax=Pyricularia oryzae TaxID=318829 RepID=A0A4P7N2T3_PYROR|nr:hypothetical protein PoMZ_09919 [Pyricularia oryzae]